MIDEAKMPIEPAYLHNQHLLRSAWGNYPSIGQLQAISNTQDQPGLGHKLSISPLALHINFPASIKDHSADACRQVLEAMMRECTTYSESLGRRPICQILLRHPFMSFNGADIIELIHSVSSQFNLNHRGQSDIEFCAELMFEDVNTDNVALLKGLGFNELLLCLPYERPNRDTGELLQKHWDQAQEFDFNNISVRMPYGFVDIDLHTLRAQLDWVLERKPQRIWLNEAADLNLWENSRDIEARCDKNGATAAAQFTLIHNALRHAGYRVLGNDCFVLAKDPLAKAQNLNQLRRTSVGYNSVNASDCLGVGPGAISNLGRHHHRNISSIDQYIAADSYPMDSQLQLNSDGKLARIIADQLLCYHRLDIPYIDNRHDAQLHTFIEQTAEALNQQAGMELIRIHNQLLQLSDEGVLRLLFIIDNFLAELAIIRGN